jgi:hypothetical protein
MVATRIATSYGMKQEAHRIPLRRQLEPPRLPTEASRVITADTSTESAVPADISAGGNIETGRFCPGYVGPERLSFGHYPHAPR